MERSGVDETLPPEVVLVDDDEDVLESLQDLVRTVANVGCLAARDYTTLVSFGERVRACRVAILDINLGAGVPSGLDAYRWLVAQGFSGRVAFLTGHAHQHPLVLEAERLGRIPILDKPATADVILDFIGKKSDEASWSDVRTR